MRYLVVMVRFAGIGAIVLLALGAGLEDGPEPDTLAAWRLYERLTEERIEAELAASEAGEGGAALAEDELRACDAALEAGQVCIRKRATLTEEGKPVAVPGGLIHHWSGTILVPGVDVERVLDFVKDYDRSHEYFEDVEQSRLLHRDGDVYDIFLRLRRQKVMTVHYNTEHRVRYRRHGPGEASSRSVATRIREIEHPGRDNESEKGPGSDRGFLWALNSYWRFQEVSGGTLVHCESVSLSRPVPQAARWLVKRFLDSVPRESLESTLGPIRAELAR